MPSNRKSCIVFRLVYLNFTLDRSKGQCQGHAHFEIGHLVNGEEMANAAIAVNIISHICYKMVLLALIIIIIIISKYDNL